MLYFSSLSFVSGKESDVVIKKVKETSLILLSKVLHSFGKSTNNHQASDNDISEGIQTISK